MPDLSALFCPKSVAIVGASRDPQKVGGIIWKNIVDSGFSGQVFPVNPNMEFKDMAGLPIVPDLAIVTVPANIVNPVLQQIGEKGTKNVVVITAGFKETDTAGEALEKELAEIAKKYGLNVIGPNCLGFVNNNCPINATFGQQIKSNGKLRFISQSGALATALFDWCDANGVGFGEFITLGNKAVINENDVLANFLQGSGPVGLYLESVSAGAEFLRVAAQISKNDPIFILKPGKSTAAAKAMRSHTGAIAGEDAVLDAVLSQAGIIRCGEMEDFFDLTRAFAWTPALGGPKVAIVSNAGGPAVVSADAITAGGLTLSEFDAQTHEKLVNLLPRTAGIGDPVDVLGDALADRYSAAAEIILSSDQTDALVAILTPQLMTQIDKTAEMIGHLAEKYHKPIFCSFIGGSLVATGEQILNQHQIPSFRFPERAIKALSAMWSWQKFRTKQAATVIPNASETPVRLDEKQIKEILALAVKDSRKSLDNLEANSLLAAAGIAVPATRVVADLDAAGKFAQEFGWPVVLKLSSPGLLHKTEIGGVVTDINDNHALVVAWDKLEQKIKQLEPEIRDHVRIQIQKEISGGVEVIVGAKFDPTFGWVLLFGAGGKLAELIADRNLRLLPIELSTACELVAGSKIFPILQGYRGEPPVALDKLYDLIVRLGKLAATLSDVTEIEINPVIVTINDAWAVDGKVVLKQGTAAAVNLPKFHMAACLAHTNPGSKFHEFIFETSEPFIGLPGQYVSVRVADQRINDYSLAGNTGPNRFTLLVDTSPGGTGSHFFENLKVGEKISFLGPFGTFTLKPEDGAKQLVFIGTGSGCSPLRNIIESALKEKNFKLPISLYFGLRYPGDIFWQDYFERLAREFPNFTFKLCLSKPDANWKGMTGHVTDLLRADLPNTSDCAAYLCGNKAMIEEATNLFLANGCPKERIYSEKFF